MHFSKPAQWGDWPLLFSGGCGQQSPQFYKTSTWVRPGFCCLSNAGDSQLQHTSWAVGQQQKRSASEKCWLMPILPVPKTNLSVPCFYKFTQDNGKTRKFAKQAVTATHTSHGTLNIQAWEVMKSCLLRKDQMKFPETTPLLCSTVASQIKSPWCLPYPCYKGKKELTTSRDYSTFSQLCFLGRWVAMQLFDRNYNHRDTIGTPKHEISAWETGLSERWYILVDLFSGKIVPLMDYSRQYNLKQSWGTSPIRKRNNPWTVKALEKWLWLLSLVTYCYLL